MPIRSASFRLCWKAESRGASAWEKGFFLRLEGEQGDIVLIGLGASGDRGCLMGEPAITCGSRGTGEPGAAKAAVFFLMGDSGGG